MKNRFFILVPSIIAATLLAGCHSTIPPRLSPPENPRTTDFSAWSAHESKLGEIIDEAQRTSPTVAAARARIRQGKANFGISSSRLFPNIGLSGGRESAGDRRDKSKSTTDTYGLSFSYSPDVFGKVSAENDALKHEIDAMEFDSIDASTALSADVAETYYSLVACNLILSNLLTEKKSLESSLEISRSKITAGTAPPDSDSSDISFLHDAETRIEIQKNECSRAKTFLSFLSGMPTGRIELLTTNSLPRNPISFIPTKDIPAEALANRPDIKSSYSATLSSASWTTAAKRSKMPDISLSGMLGSGIAVVNGTSALIRPWTFALGAAVSLIDGGANEKRVEFYEGTMDEAASNYVAKVRLAGKEAEDAMTSFSASEIKLALAEKSESEGERRLKTTMVRFDAGIVPRNDVLSAEREVLGLENTRLSALLERISSQIAIYRAIGGMPVKEKKQ